MDARLRWVPVLAGSAIALAIDANPPVLAIFLAPIVTGVESW